VEPTLLVEYAYADGSDNHVRRTSMTYPDGRVLEYHYGSGGSADDKLSRISALKINGEGSNLAEYTYLGAGSVVTAHYPQPDYTWNLATGSGATRYAGLDTFDRTLACLWLGDVSGTPDDVVHLAYQYDRASNRISREDLVSKNLGTAVYRDEAYTYDGLDRLIDVQRGELDSGSITGLNFRQNWQDPSTADTALDPTGNWADFRQDTTGNTTFDMVQTRTHNAENEITDIDATSGGSWVDPLHDAVGNMTRIPRVAAPSSNYLLTFDAWNRVVKIETGSGELTPIGDYAYDGLNRRISRTRYVSGSPDFTRRMYYTDNWQVLEERQYEDPDWLLNKQYVWGIRYIDELVLRDQDTSDPINGTLNQRHYALQDANFNVVALINTNGSVGRRYSYDAYGHSITLNADYSLGAYEYDFEYRYAGYRWDYETYLLQVRNRWYHPRLGRWVSRDPIGYRGGINLYGYVSANPIARADNSGLTSDCLCGPDITDAIVGHLNDFVNQAQRNLSPIWYSGASTLSPIARKNGKDGPLGKAVKEVTGCGTGSCAGTVTLCDMCISLYHIDHILIMVYVAESYGTIHARSAGQYNESFWLGAFIEGQAARGSSNATSNADLKFNEVALCISSYLKHADANSGATDLLTRAEICTCTKAVEEATRKAIAQKPASGTGKTGYHDCTPCHKAVTKPDGLDLPPLDL
jgi:RHS repeat-associated protein